ncbi:SRPBCC domain-containing protein [Rubellimicrobium mesophilum]|nr:SRPBCC domain-containing protein [Rubellimicrobium mesophilum]
MGRTDRADHRAAAPPGAVWAALTDPARVARWLPPEEMTARVHDWEARPGGRLRVTLAYGDAAANPGKTGQGTDEVEGRFLDAEAPSRLAWTTRFDSDDPAFAGEMTMVWSLSPEGSGTRIAVEARGVPEGIAPEDHARGLSESLRQLAEEAVRRA